MTSSRPDASRSTRSWVALALILGLAVLLVVAALTRPDGGTPAPELSGGSSAPGPTTSEAPTPDDGPAAGVVEPEDERMPDMARRDPADPLATGLVDAPVVMVVYSDYQCPFCAVWSHRTLPDLQSYVDAGDLRIEWRDVNVFGPDPERAARAAYAAGLQDQFLDYHHALFADGEKRSPEGLTDDALVDLADSLGLDTARFRTDLASAEVGDAVQANADEGAQIGAFSTPSFLIGDTPVVGAQPTDVFVTAIEDALARADG